MPELPPAVAEAIQHCLCGATGKTSAVIGIPSGGMRRVERPCPYCAAILAALDERDRAARAEVWRECAKICEGEARRVSIKTRATAVVLKNLATALRARGE